MDLAHLTNNRGARHRTKRLGCGIGSGHGKTSGRGGKGQTARTGSSIRRGFEGGQMPLYRRVPKRGFNSFWQRSFAVVSVGSLEIFSDGDVITPATLRARGLLRDLESGIKILGDGDLKKKLTVVASAFSNSALAKIQAAKGECRIAKHVDIENDYKGVGTLQLETTTPAKPSVPKPRPVRITKSAASVPNKGAKEQAKEVPDPKAPEAKPAPAAKTAKEKPPKEGKKPDKKV